MAESKPKIEAVSVVLVGSLNPQIFQPAWLASEGLIRKEEAQEAKIEVIHPEISVFSLAWARIEVTHERFAVTTSTMQQFSPELIRDLTLGVFRLLSHTPLTMLGINRSFHFQEDSEEVWHSIGHKLAPKDSWAGFLEKPGTRSVSIEGIRPDGYKGRILVKVEPSSTVHPGVFVHVNDHFVVDNPAAVSGSGEIMSILDKTWKDSLERSQEIGYGLLSRLR